MAVPERKGRPSAWLSAGVVVALIAVAAVVACVVFVDGLRRQQLAELEERLNTLGRLVDDIQREVDRHVNTSVHAKSSMSSGPKQEVVYEEVYDYDGEEEGSYEYDDEVDEEDGRKSTVKRTSMHNSSETEVATRSRRDITLVREESKPQISDSAGPVDEKKSTLNQQHQNPHQHGPAVYQEQKRPEESFVRLRHGGRSRGGHKAEVEVLSESSREEFDPQNPSAVQNGILAAHYVGDASNYNVRDHSHYYGNNILFHPYGIFKDWTPADWMSEIGSDSHFTIHHGKLNVQKSGIYFVYAQIYYAATHDRCGFHIKHNGEEVAQCMITSYGRTAKRNTCFTAVVLRLQTTDLLWTSEVEGHRNTSFKSSHSFFGLILLKPA